MMSQIGSDAWLAGSGDAKSRTVGVLIFMSAMLTYFCFIVTQRHAFAKGSYRRGSPWLRPSNRPWKRAMVWPKHVGRSAARHKRPPAAKPRTKFLRSLAR